MSRNPFKIRASFRRGVRRTYVWHPVVIPSRSGLLSDRMPTKVNPVRGRNPFKIRASFRLGELPYARQDNKVVIPSRSGLLSDSGTNSKHLCQSQFYCTKNKHRQKQKDTFEILIYINTINAPLSATTLRHLSFPFYQKHTCQVQKTHSSQRESISLPPGKRGVQD